MPPRKSYTRKYASRKPRAKPRKPRANKARQPRRTVGIGGQKKFTALNQITKQRGYSPFGNRYMAKLPYCEDFIMSTNANSAVVQSWRLNGLFDPNVALGGHQPRWFDQLSPLYNKYRVNGAHIVCTFNDPSADGVFVGLNVYNSNVTANSVAGKLASDIRERKLATVYPLNNSGSQVKTLSVYIPMAKVLGLTSAQYQSDPGTESLVNSDPAKQVWLETFVTAPTTGITPMSVSLKITYYCTFFDYNAPAQS